jgi:hypothetical protein
MTETDHLLGLVRTALDEFEDVPLSASVRRSLRIAMQRGDQDEAWFAREDLRPMGGARDLAKSEMKTIWPELSDAESMVRFRELFEVWLVERSPSQIPENLTPHFSDDGSGSMIGGSVDEIERVLSLRRGKWMEEMGDLRNRAVMESRVQVDEEILGRIRQRTFMYLCRCEAELSFASTSATVFDRHRRRVDRHLAVLAPDALDKLNASYRRARDGDPESLSQALLSCRRVLESVANIVFPARAEAYIDSKGNSRDVGIPQYRNRLFAFLDGAIAGDTAKQALNVTIDDFVARIEASDDLDQKGVHDTVTQEEVDLCVVQTYLMAGEILSMFESRARTTTAPGV